MNAEFWDAWHRKVKELRQNEPKCTCGKKHPDKTLHYANCPYLIYWDTEFEKFQKTLGKIKQMKILREYKP